jgi:hypothetical protein
MLLLLCARARRKHSCPALRCPPPSMLGHHRAADAAQRWLLRSIARHRDARPASEHGPACTQQRGGTRARPGRARTAGGQPDRGVRGGGVGGRLRSNCCGRRLQQSSSPARRSSDSAPPCMPRPLCPRRPAGTAKARVRFGAALLTSGAGAGVVRASGHARRLPCFLLGTPISPLSPEADLPTSLSPPCRLQTEPQ